MEGTSRSSRSISPLEAPRPRRPPPRLRLRVDPRGRQACNLGQSCAGPANPRPASPRDSARYGPRYLPTARRSAASGLGLRQPRASLRCAMQKCRSSFSAMLPFVHVDSRDRPHRRARSAGRAIAPGHCFFRGSSGRPAGMGARVIGSQAAAQPDGRTPERSAVYDRPTNAVLDGRDPRGRVRTCRDGSRHRRQACLLGEGACGRCCSAGSQQ